MLCNLEADKSTHHVQINRWELSLYWTFNIPGGGEINIRK